MISQHYAAARPGHGSDEVVQSLEGLDAEAVRASRLEAVARYLGLRPAREEAADGQHG